jgi:hypothetical protein
MPIMNNNDRVLLTTITGPIQELNKHIEALQNDVAYFDDEYYLHPNERIEYIGELLRDREDWLDTLKMDFSDLYWR